MHRGLAFVVAAVFVFAAARPAAASAPISPSDPRTSYIVAFRDGVDAGRASDELERDAGFVSAFRYGYALKGFAAALTATQVAAVQRDPRVAFVNVDQPVEAVGSVPLASGETAPTGVRRIQAATATTAAQASTVNVAVIDTGIDLSHPDLNAVSGTNCVNSGASAQDDNGHGTHVSGTIAAKNQGSGVVGVAPGTLLYAVKVLDRNGSGFWSWVICGIDWVTQNTTSKNIKVASMSLGGSGSNDNNCGNSNNDSLHKAICNSTNAGTTYVVAAGNSAKDFATFVPAAYPEALTVTAMSDSDGQPGANGGAPTCRTGETDDAYATFSNYATATTEINHTIAGPGVCIYSTWLGGGYNTISGTSMATPHMSGTVALCIGSGGVTGPCNGFTPAQIVQKLRADAQTHATTANGFNGDPFHPVSNRYYGYLGYAGGYLGGTPPAVTGISPTSGTAAGGTSVTITGSGFSGATAVRFGTNTASITSVTDTQITAISPAGTGTVDVTVTTPNGNSATSSIDQFTYGPSVSGVSPNSGPPGGGTSVTISGTGFSTAATVAFGTAAATNVSCSTTQCTATSPAGTDTVHVIVTVNGIASPTSAADQFTYLPAPSVTSISPTSGPQAGGTVVTINGTNFNTSGSTTVKFGANAATPVSCASTTQCTATSPAGTGAVDVTVTTSSGTSATTPADLFTYVVPPAVTGISPTSGTAAGGTAVSVNGSGFTGATAVKFGAANAQSFTVTSDTQIASTSPAGTGTVDVTVTTPNGTSATSSADRFTYGPTVSGLNPNSGPPGGGTSVTISGTGFSAGGTAVAFGPKAATTVSCATTTQCTATSPAGTGTVDVIVTVNTLASPTSAADLFTYAVDTTAPTISSVQATGISSTSATITWTTNEPADSQVEYGTSTALGTATSLNTSLVTSHSVPLGSLQPRTRYYYHVLSRDAAGNLAVSAIYSFKTKNSQAAVGSLGGPQ